MELKTMKELVARLSLENRLLKKNMTGAGGDQEWGIRPLRNLQSSGW